MQPSVTFSLADPSRDRAASTRNRGSALGYQKPITHQGTQLDILVGQLTGYIENASRRIDSPTNGEPRPPFARQPGINVQIARARSAAV